MNPNLQLNSFVSGVLEALEKVALGSGPTMAPDSIGPPEPAKITKPEPPGTGVFGTSLVPGVDTLLHPGATAWKEIEPKANQFFDKKMTEIKSRIPEWVNNGMDTAGGKFKEMFSKYLPHILGAGALGLTGIGLAAGAGVNGGLFGGGQQGMQPPSLLRNQSAHVKDFGKSEEMGNGAFSLS